ncbi:ATP-dependent nuclease [Lichenifustis flavocetrariae]|uniref:ATP-binding protein n=1 Tax=Lichenifustis flavocetrariae TaxID=2949735 RepID=A0AA42CMB3_9HYPH|nr:AAA family ATPase [Lichenifustis flavocetrariae]MCW6508180.1 ATP-binding protein [Lichenifustis flavocetrariae]
MSLFRRWGRRRSKPDEEPIPPAREAAHLHISKLTFSNGTSINLAPDAILVLTGPNNVGKSSALREIRDFLLDGRRPRPVLQDVTLACKGEEEDFKRIIVSQGIKGTSGETVKIHVHEYILSSIKEDFQRGFVGSLPMKFFAMYLGAAERLALADPVRRGDYLRDAPNEPLQWLEFDENIAHSMNAVFQSTFGQQLVLNLFAGEKLALHVVPTDANPPKEDGREYARWLSGMPLLHRQGDGMRSFTGTVLSLLIHPRNMVILDEPEAFLHPPQARRLARIICEHASASSQVLVATHNDEILRTMLEYAGDRVVIARINRHREKNSVSVLRSDELRDLWTDPSLRTSDILSSLFHEIAVICEGDADSRFFRTLLDSTKAEGRDADVRFYYFGGKDRIPSVAKALRAINVPVVAIVDIDALSDRSKFFQLFEAFGGDVTHVKSDLDLIIKSVESRKGQITGVELSIELKRISEEICNLAQVPKSVRESISSMVRSSSNWERAKQDGSRAFADASAYSAFGRLDDRCKKIGIIINPEGELERFCRDISQAKKSDWLVQVLKRDLGSDPALEDAREFAKKLRLVMSTILEDHQAAINEQTSSARVDSPPPS